ncbi:uncharacterized protein LOC116300892 [Actinia tenebrosa]|uniref:Uncharacterized protein LOC116300892 n=1 Tax=Actinia tenebrosa TaxID=6105 RepID=A0A6P8IG91_ACTTE|nr:uncharacterized protein LOC116300892 [Actinia tenebrosa]
MPSGSHFTTSSILAFISLSLIRGSFSVVIHFADLSYNSPSLVFLLRTPGTVILYICLLIFVARRDTELKHTFLNNLRNIHNYWKSAVMGFLQLAAPYLLFMYGLKVMSPTAGGVFMAAAPWTTVILERLPFIRQRSNLSPVKILAMIIGFAGVIMVSTSDVLMAVHSHVECPNYTNHTNMSFLSNRTNNSAMGSLVRNKCHKFPIPLIVRSLLALVGGCMMWSISSVFWRSYRGDIHFAVAGVWNNIFASCYALMFWVAMHRYENIDKVNWSKPDGIVSIIFLTVFSGWVAALIVDYMYRNVGPTATNRVLCLVPLFTWIEDWVFVREFKTLADSTLVVTEILGLVLVFAGLVTFSLEVEGFQNSLQTPLLSPTMDEEGNNGSSFNDGYREADDGATSEEEVENGSHTNFSHFPPLMEVKPIDIN